MIVSKRLQMRYRKADREENMDLNYSKIIERMLWVGKFRSSSALAKKLSVTPQALSNYKKNGRMPANLVLRFSNIYGLSMDWLTTGDGAVQRPGNEDMEELRGYPSVADVSMTHAKEKAYLEEILNLADISPDEIIHIGKLLKILRGSNKNDSIAVKFLVDSFSGDSEMPAAAPQKVSDSHS
jgi:transcriptional regulator with XRE-family HTH domain